MSDEVDVDAVALGDSLESTLEDFVLHAGYHLGTDVECSVSIRAGGASRRAASSGERATRCDEVEYARESGPCVEAMNTLGVQLVPDVATDDRWPDWRDACLREGFRSAAAFAVHVGPRAEMALNVYSDLVDPWTRDRIVRADVYAQQIGLVATLALQVERLQGEDALILASLEAQAEIDRAVGAVMAVHDCGAAEALTMLQTESTAEHLSLPQVATRVLRELRLPPD